VERSTAAPGCAAAGSVAFGTYEAPGAPYRRLHRVEAELQVSGSVRVDGAIRQQSASCSGFVMSMTSVRVPSGTVVPDDRA